jgi:hypothetical protein
MFCLSLLVTACLLPSVSCRKQPQTNTQDSNQPEKEAGLNEPAKDKVVQLAFELPNFVFQGTKQNIRVENLEPLSTKDREPFYAPLGTKIISLGKPVTSATNPIPIFGDLSLITDGDKEAAEGSGVELGLNQQSIIIDLKGEFEIYAILVWHYHKQPQVYYDVIVQVADDSDFITNVRTLFNNDIDNSIGHGIGTDMHYVENHRGKLIDAKGTRAGYVRLYSNGNNNNKLNHYIEVEVWGKPVK